MSAKRDITVLVQRTLRTVRNFLLSPKSREFLLFLFFLVVASFFWMLQKLNDTYEMELKMPLRVENVPQNVVMTLPPPEQVRVQVKDRGTVLINYVLGRSFYPITLNFSDMDNDEGYVRMEASSYQKLIASQLMNTTQIVAVKPYAFDVVYTRGDAKKVPVVFQGQIDTEKQYYVSDMHIRPDSTLVYAPHEILDTLAAVYTENIVYAHLADTVRRQEKLLPVTGAKFVPNEVELEVCTDMYTEKRLEIPIQAVNFPPDKTLKTFPSKVTLTFQVGLARFKSVTEDDFLIAVTYDELLKCGSEKYRVKLKSMPDDVSYVRIDPSEVDFIIEQLDTYVAP